MPFENEPVWRQTREIRRTPANLEHPRTPATLKMMVMTASGFFIARRIARQFDSIQPPVLHQGIDGAVHGGDPQPLERSPTGHQHLEWTQGLFGVSEHISNRISLSCIAFHNQHVVDKANKTTRSPSPNCFGRHRGIVRVRTAGASAEHRRCGHQNKTASQRERTRQPRHPIFLASE